MEREAIANRNIPKIAVSICPIFTSLKSGPGPCAKSITAIISRLNIILPKIFPIAKSGALIKAALELDAISGKDVARGIKAAPIHNLPKPLFSAMISP